MATLLSRFGLGLSKFTTTPITRQISSTPVCSQALASSALKSATPSPRPPPSSSSSSSGFSSTHLNGSHPHPPFAYSSSGSSTPSPSPSPSPLSPASTSPFSCANQTAHMTRFPGAQSAYRHDAIEFVKDWPLIPCFRRMNEKGELLLPDYKIIHSDETLLKMYTTMTTLNVMDGIFYDAQRQGRISFYMTNYGEEATHIGSAAALDNDDVIFGQYREAGVLMWRGFTLEEFSHQCFSNEFDLGKGRQMPVHYGSRRLHFQTISSPLGTQIPQAVGAAYAAKMEKKGKCVICYFGDGAASEGDFHAALNMSATLSTPVIFFCRNNGYAISTPTHEQYKGDGIAARGHGYGITTIRVDGNDLLAVYDVVAAARKIAVEENKPVLIEAMTYRGGHHSTSDDSTRYRGADEIQFWAENDNPITRFRLLLERRGLWDSHKESSLRKSLRTEVLSVMTRAERVAKPAASQLFQDVYDTLPKHLLEQQQQLKEHLAEYGSKYGLEEFAKEETYVDPSTKS